MTFKEFSKTNRQRCESPEGFNHKMSDWSVAEWTNAMAGECGEACNVAKKLLRHRDHISGNYKPEDTSVPVLIQKLGSEIADTIIYADLVLQSIGLDLEAVLQSTFNAKSAQLGCISNFAIISEETKQQEFSKKVEPQRSAKSEGPLVGDAVKIRTPAPYRGRASRPTRPPVGDAVKIRKSGVWFLARVVSRDGESFSAEDSDGYHWVRWVEDEGQTWRRVPEAAIVSPLPIVPPKVPNPL